jgi:apolipoprotein N-acyltransferase
MKYECILISAFLLYLALTIPSWCACFVFLYLIPIFYLVIRNHGRLSFSDGFLWGAALYGVHWYDIAILAHMHGHGVGRYAVMPFLVLCGAVYAGLWFWVSSQLTVCTKQSVIAWIGSTWMYTIFMQRASFWMLGRIQGYPFSFPLLPLAEYPPVLSMLQHVRPQLLLLLLIMGSWFCAYILHKKRGLGIRLATATCYAPFMIGFLIVRQNCEVPAYHKTVGYVSPHGLPTRTLERVGCLARRCNDLINRNGDIKYITTPESTLPRVLNEQSLVEVMTQNLCIGDAILFLGSQCDELGHRQNCCYLLQFSLITQRYDKSLLVPYAEYIPNTWLNFECINRIFLQNNIIIDGRRKKGDFFSDFCPMICSDYYLDWYDEPQETDVPLLLMVNENWFNGKTFRYLMKLAARYGALARRQDVIYVAHTEGFLFSRNGDIYPLIQ